MVSKMNVFPRRLAVFFGMSRVAVTHLILTSYIQGNEILGTHMSHSHVMRVRVRQALYNVA